MQMQPSIVDLRAGLPAESLAVRFEAPELLLVEHRCALAASGSAELPATKRMPVPTFGFVRHGLALLETSRGAIRADPTQVVLFDQGSSYRAQHLGCDRRACAVTLSVAPKLLQGTFRDHGCALASAGGLRFPVSAIPRPPRLNLLLHRVLASISIAADDIEELLLTVVGIVAEELGGRSATSPLGSPRLVRRAQELLADRLHDPPDLEQLARAANCSRYHLCRVFKSQTGLTISRYLHRLRVNEALSRILEGETRLTRLAHDLGFSSHSHFTQVFRREIGLTPSAVRTRLGRRGAELPSSTGRLACD